MNIHFIRSRGFSRVLRRAGLVLICLANIFPALSQPILQARLTPTLTIAGPLGSTQQIQYSTNLSDPNGWTILSNLKQDLSSKLFFDTAASGQKRFYRSVTVGLADTNFIWIPPGTFLMGSPDTEAGRSTNEGPQTLVTLTDGFFMNRFEVRGRDWLLISNTIPIYGIPDVGFVLSLDVPMNLAKWTEASNYCAAKTALDLSDGKTFPGMTCRFPMEVEWEYACRAGSTTPFSLGNELRADDVRVDAAFDGRFPYPPGIVPTNPISPQNLLRSGSYNSNAFGLYDMHGNADEWCLDGYNSSTLPGYSGGSVTNPIGDLSAPFKIVRGGSFGVSGALCRSAARRARPVTSAGGVSTGFRTVIPGFVQTNLQPRLTPGFDITGPIGSMQQIQYSTNLADPNGWSVLSHVRMDVSPKSFFDTAVTGPQRFYRTLIVPVADTNLVWISPGTFLMGSPDTEEGHSTNEAPQTQVTFTRGFFMGSREVTYGEWAPYLPGPNGVESNATPVGGILWGDATNYCALRTASEQAAGKIPAGWAYRLPSEAEWEYACRAGTTTAFSVGNQLRSDSLRVDANFVGSSPYPGSIIAYFPTNLTAPVSGGAYNLNAFGLYDMHGNLEEWCMDGTVPGVPNTPLPYPGGTITDPVATVTGTFRMIRGGWLNATGAQCRSAARRTRSLGTSINTIGFRVVLAPTGT